MELFVKVSALAVLSSSRQPPQSSVFAANSIDGAQSESMHKATSPARYGIVTAKITSRICETSVLAWVSNMAAQVNISCKTLTTLRPTPLIDQLGAALKELSPQLTSYAAPQSGAKPP